MIESKYVLSIDVDGEKYKYNLINGYYAKEKDTENSKNFYVNENTNEFKKLIEYNYGLRSNSDFICITLEITKECNFRCVYCFQNHEKRKLGIESIPELGKIIKEYVKRNIQIKKLVVIWFGGEPTMNIPYICNANKMLKDLSNEMELTYSSRIISNGYLLNEIIPYIKEWNLSDIQITFDGTKKIHDSRRKCLDNTGSFDKIVDNILLIHDKVDLIIRVNVDSENIDNIYDLYDMIRKLRFDSRVQLYFQPMLVENYGGESECYLGNTIQDEKLYEKYIKLLIHTKSIIKPCFLKAFCNVDFPGSLVVSSEARLFKCWAESGDERKAFAQIGADNYSKIVEEMSRGYFQIKDEACYECKFFPVCMGGCKYKKYDKEECAKRQRMITEKIKYCIRNKI